MSLFSFGDINFYTDTRTGKPSDLLNGAESKYAYNISRFPLDVGSVDKGHYLVIHINSQRQTRYVQPTIDDAGERPSVYENRIKNGTKPIGGFDTVINSALDSVKNLSKSTSGHNSKVNNSIQSGIDGIKLDTTRYATEFIRTIQRTKETIALYMPDTLAFTYQQNYSQMSLTGGLAKAVTLGASAVDSYKNSPAGVVNTFDAMMKNLSPFLASFVLKNKSTFTSSMFTAVTGVVQNPMLEIIYSSPEFRSFRFDFMFYPRQEKEGREVQKIIEKLKFHQAPEILKESNGFFLVPPSEFDIKFFYNGKENPNIPQISTCVLESIDVDYAPNGFSAYEVPGQLYPTMGGTGMPVGIRLSLQFRETEYLTKANFNWDKPTDQIAQDFANKAWLNK